MENERTNEINIMDIIFILKKNFIAIISAAVVMAIIAYVYTVTMVVPMYRSTTQILIKALTEDAMTVYSDSSSRLMLVNNSIEVLGGTEVMGAIVDDLELDMTPEQLQSCVSISSPEDTQVLKFSVTHPDAETAKKIASQMVIEAEDVLAEDVGVAALSVIQEAKTPNAPISPNPVKNTVMGGFLGAFAAAALVVLIRFINNKIYSSDDVERVLGLTVLSSIPEITDNTTVYQENSISENNTI